MLARAGDPLRATAALPEPNVAVFAFLLNFVWEFWQIPLFRGDAQGSALAGREDVHDRYAGRCRNRAGRILR